MPNLVRSSGSLKLAKTGASYSGSLPQLREDFESVFFDTYYGSQNSVSMSSLYRTSGTGDLTGLSWGGNWYVGVSGYSPLNYYYSKFGAHTYTSTNYLVRRSHSSPYPNQFYWQGTLIGTANASSSSSNDMHLLTTGGYTYSRGAYQYNDGTYSYYGIAKEESNSNIPTSGAISMGMFYGKGPLRHSYN